MGTNTKSFATGVLIALLFMFLREWGLNEQWKIQAWEHHAAVYYFKVNDPLRWMWYDDYLKAQKK